MGEGIVEVIECDFHQGVVDGIDDFFPTAWPETAYPLLQFGEDVLDRIQIGRIGWQVDHLCADTLDRGDCRTRFMAAEVIENDQVTGMQSRSQQLLAEPSETVAVERPVENHRGTCTVQRYRVNQRGSLPIATGNRLH